MYILNIILSLSIILLPHIEGGVSFLSNDAPKCEIVVNNACCNTEISHASCCIEQAQKCGCHISNSDETPIQPIVYISPQDNSNNNQYFNLVEYGKNYFNITETLTSQYVALPQFPSFNRNLPLLI